MKHFTAAIVVLSDGSRTVAEGTLFSDLGTVTTGKGSSGREPGDKTDAQTGEDLAVARMLRSMAAHLERRANGRMRHIESVKAHRQEIAAEEADKRASQPLTPGEIAKTITAAGLLPYLANKSWNV